MLKIRLLLKLKSQKDYVYDTKYYHKLHGFLGDQFIGTEYQTLKDKPGYKFYSYSNIFPIQNNKYGSIKNLIIASPNEKFIGVLKEKFKEIKEKDKLANIGEMSFKVESISMINPKIRKNCRLITATPLSLEYRPIILMLMELIVIKKMFIGEKSILLMLLLSN